MAQLSGQTKFEALIRNSLFDAVTEWFKTRGKPSNTQLGEAMFRLFLAAPNWVKLLAFIASTDELQAVPLRVWRDITESLMPRPTEGKDLPDPIEEARHVVEAATPELIKRQVDPKQLSALRETLGLPAVSTEYPGVRPAVDEIARTVSEQPEQSSKSSPGRRRKGVGG